MLPLLPETQQRQIIAAIPREPLPTAFPNSDVRLIAHRGALQFAPENTLAAFDKALEIGFDIIEFDVRSTRDGVPVVFHDKTVDRTTDGTGNLSDYTWEELQQLDAGSWFAPEFAGTRVPSLEAALAHLQGRTCVMWDVKGRPTAAMVALFKKYGFVGDCVLTTYGGFGAFNPDRFGQELLRLWPDAPLLLVARAPEDIDRLLAEFPQLSAVVGRTAALSELVTAAHQRGVRVFSSG